MKRVAGFSEIRNLVRTLEYWDIEKKKYPQYDHTAVIVAENITSRFLNVISLFNGFIPLMAMQVTAIEISDGEVGLQFTKVLDTVRLGNIDEEVTEPTDRNYWENRGTKKTVALADRISTLVHEFAPGAELSYNKYYIGFRVDGSAYNFAKMRPQKKGMKLEIRLPKNEQTDELINNAEHEVDYQQRSGSYRLSLSTDDLESHKTTISTLLEQAYNTRT